MSFGLRPNVNCPNAVFLSIPRDAFNAAKTVCALANVVTSQWFQIEIIEPKVGKPCYFKLNLTIDSIFISRLKTDSFVVFFFTVYLF